MNDDRRDMLKSLLSVVDTKATQENFVKVVKQVVDLFTRMKADLQEERAALRQDVANAMLRISQRLSDVRDGKDGRNGRDGIDGRDGKGVDGKDGAPGPKGDKGEPGDIKDLSPQEIRDELELLQGDERLDKSAIKGLDEALRRISSRAGGSGGGGGGGGATRGRLVAYDLSDQLDGVLTTFSLPAFWKIVDVKLSSVPVMRLNTDYTVDGSNFRITFTSEINPSTDLSAGQSAIIIYAEI